MYSTVSYNTTMSNAYAYSMLAVQYNCTCMHTSDKSYAYYKSTSLQVTSIVPVGCRL